MDTREIDKPMGVADCLVVLYRRAWVFFLVFVMIILLALAYGMLAKKTWELTATVCVGKFQGDLLEEGEFVAQKLEDYSFIKRAMDAHDVKLEIPVSRLQKLIKTEVVNEVKKTKDVGLVQLTVRYKGRDKVVEITKALTDELIRDHQVLLDHSLAVLKQTEDEMRAQQDHVGKTVEEDELLSRKSTLDPGQRTVPSLLLLEHSINERRYFRANVTKDIHEIRVDAEAATSSFNTKLAAEPELPDSHLKPKLGLVLVLGLVAATILATFAAFFYDLMVTEVVPKIRESRIRREEG